MKKLLIIAVSVFCLAFTMNTEARAADDMAVGGGLGLTLPVGSDIGDFISFAMPILINFQYAVDPQITIEADFYYTIYTSLDSAVDSVLSSFTVYQIGATGRYWLDNAFDGAYFGGGLGIATAKASYKGGGSISDSDLALVMKGGYTMNFKQHNDIYLDFGGRLDLIDFDVDMLVLTGYAMVVKTF